MTILSNSNEWQTPDDLYGNLNYMYGAFTLDAAANEINTKTTLFLRDSLNISWGRSGSYFGHRVWMNPPYSRGNLDKFMAKARFEVESKHCDLVTCLVPGHTADGWWHKNVDRPGTGPALASAQLSTLGLRVRLEYSNLTIETIRLKGRVHFVELSGKTGPARFPSVVVTYAMPGVLPPLVW